MKMQITFPGGAGVDTAFRGFTVRTDQPPKAGGEGSAPAPFDLFLASLGTCAGYYALRFLQSRELATEGLELSLETERDPETKRLAKIHLDLRLPEEFPEKYRAAILRAMEQCAVKKVLDDPPEFVVRTEVPRRGSPEAADELLELMTDHGGRSGGRSPGREEAYEDRL